MGFHAKWDTMQAATGPERDVPTLSGLRRRRASRGDSPALVRPPVRARICIYVSMYLYVYGCICMYMYVYGCMYMYICICMYMASRGDSPALVRPPVRARMRCHALRLPQLRDL